MFSVDVVVKPPMSQFFKYQSFFVSCSDGEQEQEVPGWTVMKRMEDGEVGDEPSLCAIEVYYPQSLCLGSSVSILLHRRHSLPCH